MRTTSLLFAAALSVCLVGCSTYEAMPIGNRVVEKQLTPPPLNVLQARASELKHPILKPIRLDWRNGIDPDQAAVLAVLLNPALRAARDQRQATAAMVLTAGILPNPQVSLSEDFRTGGAPGVTAYLLGLSWDATELITRGTKINAAQAAAASVELDIAWQEWQVALTAKTAVYDLISLTAQLELAKEVEQSLAQNATILQGAVERHEKTVIDQAAAESASLDAHIAVLTAQRDLRHQRLVLNKAIGLPPETNLPLATNVQFPSQLQLPTSEMMLSGLENRRLDLVALRQGYASQEETVRGAVLAQFPKINVGFNRASDNTPVRSAGFGVTVDVPIFDRNQGVIATEKATRQRLFDEYVQRTFEARSDVASAMDDIQAIQDQLAATEAAIPSLQKLVDSYKANMDRGNVDVLSYYTAVGNAVGKKLDALKLKQQLMDNRIALELAIGQYMPAENQPAPSTAPATTPSSGTTSMEGNK